MPVADSTQPSSSSLRSVQTCSPAAFTRKLRTSLYWSGARYTMTRSPAVAANGWQLVCTAEVWCTTSGSGAQDSEVARAQPALALTRAAAIW